MSAHGQLNGLWMDLKSSVQVEDTPSIFKRHCRITRTSGFDEIGLEREDPDFVVLEFDYPSRQDLARAASFKQKFPSVPMVVVTVQHSEALAVWFFRAKFYDYLVQPLSAAEVSNCIHHLEQAVKLKREQKGRAAARFVVRMPAEASSATNPRTHLQPALTLVERNYHQRLLVTDAAEKCGLAPFRFGREFKEHFGMDFREYLLRYRIREACRLLRNPRVSVTEVGYSVGFSEPSYFTKAFKKLVGVLPSQAVGAEGIDCAIHRDDDERNYQSSLAKS
jgi:AraC-like DNA-binding protein/CheY-like chemotaxis protein